MLIHAFSLSRPTLFLVQSRSRSGRHVSTRFLDPVLGAMMKQVGWHSRRPSLERGPQHEGVTEGREGNGRKPPPPIQCATHPLGIRRAGCFLLLCISQTPEMHPRPFFEVFGIRSGPSPGVLPHPQGHPQASARALADM